MEAVTKMLMEKYRIPEEQARVLAERVMSGSASTSDSLKREALEGGANKELDRMESWRRYAALKKAIAAGETVSREDRALVDHADARARARVAKEASQAYAALERKRAAMGAYQVAQGIRSDLRAPEEQMAPHGMALPEYAPPVPAPVPVRARYAVPVDAQYANLSRWSK
jgi:hypothetical protein